jgi:hypothetical protein
VIRAGRGVNEMEAVDRGHASGRCTVVSELLRHVSSPAREIIAMSTFCQFCELRGENITQLARRSDRSQEDSQDGDR